MKTISFIILLFNTVIASSQIRINSFMPDTTINGNLKILNSLSIEKYLGNQKGILIEDEKASRVQYVNVTKRMYLILYHLNGANANSFNKFEVGRVKDKKGHFRQTAYKEFASESGIRIDMKFDSLIKIKGKNFNRFEQDGYLVIKYQVKGSNSFLKRYDMPIYEAEYYFKKGKLVKFVFGFPSL